MVNKLKVKTHEVLSTIAKLEKSTTTGYELKIKVYEQYGQTIIAYWYEKIPFDWRGYDR